MLHAAGRAEASLTTVDLPHNSARGDVLNGRPRSGQPRAARLQAVSSSSNFAPCRISLKLAERGNLP